MDDTFHEFSGATDTSPAYSNSDDMRSTTVSLQKRIAGKVSTAMIRGKNDRATHTPHWLGNIARLSYASVGQLRAWYDTEGCDIVKSVITSRNTKKAWLDYSLDFNLRNGLEKGFLLPSTMAGVIHIFGVRHINKLNFLWLLSGKITSDDISPETDTEKWRKKYIARAEDLRDWYDNKGGKGVVDECLNSDNYAQAWKEYATNFNIGTCVDVWYSLPVTVHSLVHAFGVKKINKMTFSWFLSGEMTKDDFETRIQDGDRKLSSRYSATREILQEWYKKGGDSIIETMLAVPGYKKAWKDYVRKFNKEQSLTKWYRLQETIWGVVRVFYPNETSYNKRLFLSCFSMDLANVQEEVRVRNEKTERMRKKYPPLFPIKVPTQAVSEASDHKRGQVSVKKNMERARQSLDNIIKGESINLSQILFVNNRFPSFLHIPRKYLGPFHLFIRKTERTLHDRGIVRKEPISEKDIILKIIPDGKSSYGKIIIRDAALQKYMEDLEQCLDETLEWWSNSVNEKIRTNHGDPSVHLVLE